MGLVGSSKAGSSGLTETWVTRATAPRIQAASPTRRRARQMRLPSWPSVMAPRENSGWAGTSRAPSSCWMARLPTWGPLPCTSTTRQPVRSSEQTDLAMRVALASSSS